MSEHLLCNRNIREEIQLGVKKIIEQYISSLDTKLLQSPRAFGDNIQDLVSDNFGTIAQSYIKEYSQNFARRAMADLAFTDKNDIYYVVDVKTHRTDAKFNMPNLTSVERLARFYQDSNNVFCLLKINYTFENVDISIGDILFVPIEHISWSCLTIGALGWGQIQIANANHVVLDSTISRKQWMLDFCDIMLSFYPKEMEKISDRMRYFQKVKTDWERR